jgi:hypothetical protein
MRIGLVASLLLLTATVPATAQVSLSINIGSYPNFTAVPGYPVYYAPDVSANYFFYDGLYWLYQDDYWYSSSWYNGPWNSVDPMYVPIYILQVPVRYYRRPPQYFRGWQPDQSPRWNDHWGHNWAQRRPDWDRPRHGVNVAPAPLPDYQRRYSGKDYPRADQQQAIRQQNYHYQARGSEASRDADRRSNEHKPGFVKPAMQVQPARRAPQQEQRMPATPKPAQPQVREPQDRAAQGRGNAGAGEGDRKQKPHQDQSGERDQKRDPNH